MESSTIDWNTCFKAIATSNVQGSARWHEKSMFLSKSSYFIGFVYVPAVGGVNSQKSVLFQFGSFPGR